MRVLVAEDDPIVAAGLAERLRAIGHEPVGPVGDGEQAIATAQAEEPDVYLFDIGLPMLDGIEAARRLAEAGLRRPTVVVTGAGSREAVERTVAAGADAYLAKPVDTEELDAAILIAALRHTQLAAARQELEDRKVVERAKGLLMNALRVSEEDAFRRLQRTARERNLRLIDVAHRIVEQRSLLESAV
jgi:two-component system, response regulator PdtaR